MLAVNANVKLTQWGCGVKLELILNPQLSSTFFGGKVTFAFARLAQLMKMDLICARH